MVGGESLTPYMRGRGRVHTKVLGNSVVWDLQFDFASSLQTAYWGSRAKKLNKRWFNAKSTDPQLMKENKVTYPRESRIAGHTKQSNMAEEAENVVGWKAVG